MARWNAYTATVASRTRLAQSILDNPELLADWEAGGGLKEDLEEIVSTGLAAEAANLGQSITAGEGVGATKSALLMFENLRNDYVKVMNVVQAVRSDLVRGGAGPEVVAGIDQIIKNEVPVRIVATKTAAGTVSKKATRTQSFEAIRAEIQKDAGALRALKEAAAAFERRKVNDERLAALEKAAAALSGKLGEKVTKKGAAKAATAAEHAAVAAQKQAWASSYRLLADLGRADARVALLLKDAARAR